MKVLECFLLQDLPIGRLVFRQRSLTPSNATRLSDSARQPTSDTAVRRAYHQAYYEQAKRYKAARMAKS